MIKVIPETEYTRSILLVRDDCMNYMKSIPDKHYPLAFCDPPYGNGSDKPTKKPGKVKQKNGSFLPVKVADYGKKSWDVIPDAEYFREIKRISVNQIIWGVNYYDIPELIGGRIVWNKMNGRSDQFGCEIAYNSFNNRTDVVHYMWRGMFQGKVASVVEKEANIQIGNKKLNEKRIHSAQKPIILLRWILDKYAKPGYRVFDSHGGSLNLAVACMMNGLGFDGCEKDPEIFDVGVENVLKHQRNFMNTIIIRSNE